MTGSTGSPDSGASCITGEWSCFVMDALWASGVDAAVTPHPEPSWRRNLPRLLHQDGNGTRRLQSLVEKLPIAEAKPSNCGTQVLTTAWPPYVCNRGKSHRETAGGDMNASR